MTAAEKRRAVVDKGKTRVGKNKYTSGVKRTQVANGYSDCSSFVRWCYLQIIGQDIGINTAAQITNKRLINVADIEDIGGKMPPESTLLPGDLIFFVGSDPSRPRGCGHVEMYMGDGKLIGHGSGIGPVVKDMASYCKNKAAAGRGWICALRVIAEDSSDTDPTPPDPIPPKPPAKHGVQITGNGVNLRFGPGAQYEVYKKKASFGDVFDKPDQTGWLPILLDGVVLWVSAMFAKEV